MSAQDHAMADRYMQDHGMQFDSLDMNIARVKQLGEENQRAKVQLPVLNTE
jgi:hypothetical protein